MVVDRSAILIIIGNIRELWRKKQFFGQKMCFFYLQNNSLEKKFFLDGWITFENFAFIEKHYFFGKN